MCAQSIVALLLSRQCPSSLQSVPAREPSHCSDKGCKISFSRKRHAYMSSDAQVSASINEELHDVSTPSAHCSMTRSVTTLRSKRVSVHRVEGFPDEAYLIDVVGPRFV